MTLTDFFAELESYHPTLTVDYLGRIRQNGPAPGEMSCPLQIVFGHTGYMSAADYAGLAHRESCAVINAADYPDHPDLLAKEIRKRLLELVMESK